MERTIETSLDNILSLITVSYDYGFDDDILLGAFADMLEHSLSDEEIESYAASVMDDDACGIEDYSETVHRLRQFRLDFILNP